MSSTFGHRIEQPHPEGYTLPSAQDDWSEPADLDRLKADAAAVGGNATDPVIMWSGYGVAALACALALYDLYQPSPTIVAVLLVAPLAVMALLLQSPISFEVNSRRGGRIVNVVLILPFGLLLMANSFHAQVDPLWPLIPAAVVGLAMLLTAATLRARQQLENQAGFIALVAVCGALYGYGATSLIDIQFDTSAGQSKPVQVVDLYRSCGRSCSYHVELRAGGAYAYTSWVDVSSGFYAQLHVGDTVCVVRHPGALTLPWYKVGFCGAGPAT